MVAKALFKHRKGVWNSRVLTRVACLVSDGDGPSLLVVPVSAYR
jgi:hypothetical protein